MIKTGQIPVFVTMLSGARDAAQNLNPNKVHTGRFLRGHLAA